MKTIAFIILLLIAGGHLDAQTKKRTDSVQVVITLNNKANRNATVDSVYLIFDRFGLNGAGVVRQLYYPVGNTITLSKVPEGRFYITVICLGIYKDVFTETSFLYEKRRNKNEFEFRLEATGAYDPATVSIPQEKINPAKLSIVRCKLRN